MASLLQFMAKKTSTPGSDAARGPCPPSRSKDHSPFRLVPSLEYAIGLPFDCKTHERVPSSPPGAGGRERGVDERAACSIRMRHGETAHEREELRRLRGERSSARKHRDVRVREADVLPQPDSVVAEDVRVELAEVTTAVLEHTPRPLVVFLRWVIGKLRRAPVPVLRLRVASPERRVRPLDP